MSQPPEMQFPGWTTAQLQHALNLSLQRPLMTPTTSTPDQHGTPPQLLQQPHMGGAPLVTATATQQVPAPSLPCQMSASGLAALPQTTAPTTMQITAPTLTTTTDADSGDTIVIDSTTEEHRLSTLDARLTTEADRRVTFGKWREGKEKGDEEITFFQHAVENVNYAAWAQKHIENNTDTANNFCDVLLGYAQFVKDISTHPAWKRKLTTAKGNFTRKKNRKLTPVPATLRRSRSRESERPLDTVVPGTTNPIRGHPVPTGVGPNGPPPQLMQEAHDITKVQTQTPRQDQLQLYQLLENAKRARDIPAQGQQTATTHVQFQQTHNVPETGQLVPPQQQQRPPGQQPPLAYGQTHTQPFQYYAQAKQESVQQQQHAMAQHNAQQAKRFHQTSTPTGVPPDVRQAIHDAIAQLTSLQPQQRMTHAGTMGAPDQFLGHQPSSQIPTQPQKKSPSQQPHAHALVQPQLPQTSTAPPTSSPAAAKMAKSLNAAFADNETRAHGSQQKSARKSLFTEQQFNPTLSLTATATSDMTPPSMRSFPVQQPRVAPHNDPAQTESPSVELISITTVIHNSVASPHEKQAALKFLSDITQQANKAKRQLTQMKTTYEELAAAKRDAGAHKSMAEKSVKRAQQAEAALRKKGHDLDVAVHARSNYQNRARGAQTTIANLESKLAQATTDNDTYLRQIQSLQRSAPDPSPAGHRNHGHGPGSHQRDHTYNNHSNQQNQSNMNRPNWPKNR